MNTSVKSGASRVMRIGLAAIGGVVVIGLIAPFISAGRFSGRIQQALEDSLGRKVHFSKVRFTLFSGPGFALEDVTIDEDPHYGLEPFAYVTTLNARLRLDKLLLGRMAFANLQLIDPSLNLVKRSDGTWNAIELIERFTAPRRAPLNLFPAMNVLGARIDFKFGARKTALYIADADLTIYPEHSGKLYIRFSGSPARTDRAGNGFGHLRGAATWSMNARGSKEKELQADVILDPSNLSEMTTLVEGHDAGVHGTVSSHASIEGPLTNLRVSGELHLDDVHRWDLLPSSGETLRIRYRGDIDLLAHRFDVETFPLHPGETTPVALQVRVADFLTRPTYSIFVRLDKAPVEGLLPLSRRMGLTLPQDVKLQGALDGVIGYSNTTGLLGGIVVNDLTASLPNGPPLTAPLARANISADSVHFEPAAIQT
ncbi:MAG: AsmA family protein, partial [Acidobacteriaceae bacterium]|nr:AsmA family protein [Acidobacteriaceae bacterium]